MIPRYLQLESIKDGIMKHMASSQQSEVKAWEEQLEACEHTLLLNQEEVGPGFQGEYIEPSV